MSVSQTATEIMNALGGQRYINNLMNPKMLIDGDNSFGIRLKRANKNKINHIEISRDETTGVADNNYKVVFWAFSKDFMSQDIVAVYGNQQLSEIKAAIEAQTNFVFQKGDSQQNEGIAKVILDQLGGIATINMMLGVEQSLPIENGVFVKFKVGAANDINSFQVVLDPSDTYTVKFFKVTPTKKTEISSTSMVYNDMLISIIQNELQCSLIRPRFV